MGVSTRKEALTVVVVEDDADARLMYCQYLRSKKCRVYAAADGRAGIDQALELRPDLIVLDLAMPRVDGWTVLSHLRESSWTADIPIIVCTAITVKPEELLAAGASACVPKPCTPELIWEYVQALTGPGLRRH